MRATAPPSDLGAERALLGGLLTRSSALGDLQQILDPSDFYRPLHQAVYAAMLTMHEAGEDIDQITVADHVREASIEDLAEMMNDTPAVSRWAHYADIIIGHSRRRRLIHQLAEVVDGCMSGGDPDYLIGEAQTILADPMVGSRSVDVDGLISVTDFMARAPERSLQYPWLIPYQVRLGWRIIIIGPEGVGKGTLMRQIAVHAAAGRNPFATNDFIDPVRTLFIDVENPETTIERQLRIANTTSGINVIEEAGENLMLWNVDGGLDIRSRRDRAKFEAVIHRVRPQLVCAGPFYKLFRRGSNEDLEQVTIEFLKILDDLRTRYKFAIILEHHQPKAQGGSAYRTKDPFGSAALKRWPEMGITLEPDGIAGDVEVNDYFVGRFREDREPNDWPTQIFKRRQFQTIAWDARWEHGRGLRE